MISEVVAYEFSWLITFHAKKAKIAVLLPRDVNRRDDTRRDMGITS